MTQANLSWLGQETGHSNRDQEAVHSNRVKGTESQAR